MRKLSSRDTRLLAGAALIAVGIVMIGLREGATAYPSRLAVTATPVPTIVPAQSPPVGALTRPPTIINSPPPALATPRLVRTPPPAAPMPPAISAEDKERFGISNATDVTADPTAVRPTPAVDASQAVAIAAAHVGFQAANARVLHGSIQSASGAERPAWVILFGGGELPVLGPAGAASGPPVARTFTGVAVDSATGEVLTWFMR